MPRNAKTISRANKGRCGNKEIAAATWTDVFSCPFSVSKKAIERVRTSLRLARMLPALLWSYLSVQLIVCHGVHHVQVALELLLRRRIACHLTQNRKNVCSTKASEKQQQGISPHRSTRHGSTGPFVDDGRTKTSRWHEFLI